MKQKKLFITTIKWCETLLVGLLFWGLSACTLSGPQPPPSMKENTIPSPREILDSVGTRNPLPKLKPLTTLEPQVAAQTEFPYEGKLFSLSVRDMPLEDVLLSLAKEANLNLVIDREVNRKEPVSVEFSNIPLQTALDNLMAVYDYFYTIKQGVLHVRAFEERIFHLNYPLVSNNPDSKTGGDVLGSSGGGGGKSDTIQTAQGGSLKGEFKITTKVEDDDNLDVWKRVEESLKPAQANKTGLLSSDGMVRINRMGSTILVKDHPKNIRAVAKFLENIQESLQRQVIIEAKIVEVVLDKSHQYGINWEHVRLDFLNSGGALETSMNLGELGTTGAFTMHFSEFIGMDKGEAFLHALATNGQVNILSSPRMNVLNNQSAFINVGRVVPFLDFKIGESTSGGTGGTSERTTIDSVPVISRFNEGVSLGITPQIDDNGTTVLHIIPIVTEQTGTEAIEVPSTTVGGESVVANIPVISIRESDTVVRVADQKTIVIGGLISEKTGDTVKKVPLLGDIPFVNWLFSHQNRQNKKTELVILLTTTVVMR